jgi:hypothetical protein
VNSISNVYGHGFYASDVSRLESLGFRIRPEVFRYPGAQLCRFIDFESGPSLEVIDVENEDEYLSFLPAGMEAYSPGISVGVDSSGALDDAEQALSRFGPYRLHVNYDSRDDVLGAGWNYLNFSVPIVERAFVWLTAYDEPRPRVEGPAGPHPNGVRRVEALAFDLADRALTVLRTLISDSEPGDVALRDNGVEISARDALSGLPDNAEKRFCLRAVVLSCESLEAFRHLDGVTPCSIAGADAVLVETNALSWDLVITEREQSPRP